MPGMQWLGSMPRDDNNISSLGRAMEKGTEGFTAGMAGAEKRRVTRGVEAREEKRIGIQEQQLKKQLETIDYEKKRDAANMVISVAKTLRPEAAEEFINKGEIKALFEDLKWPLPTGLHGEVDFKEAAQEAVMKGEPLPGLTMEETKKKASVYIKPDKPPKITAADVKGTPWSMADIVPWRESEKEKMERLRKEQFRGATFRGMESDPLNARGRR